ncbi:MAG: hypothetical protein F4118_00345 [Acidimicrobiaceae bacterium]|nr:hypothetical protein [Candidatus Poribacteria bacterium]MYI34871.1 hypothetical protein [Acidimicrobiaceae bacterium]
MNGTKEEALVKITKGKVESGNCVYEFTLGYCEGNVYPYITIDYRVLPDGMSMGSFGGRSPQALIDLLKEQDYPVPAILEKWEKQVRQVTISMLSGADGMILNDLQKHYTEQLTVEEIEAFIRKEVDLLFQEATIVLALHTYWGLKTAHAWNESLEQILQQNNEEASPNSEG